MIPLKCCFQFSGGLFHALGLDDLVVLLMMAAMGGEWLIRQEGVLQFTFLPFFRFLGTSTPLDLSGIGEYLSLLEGKGPHLEAVSDRFPYIKVCKPASLQVLFYV